MNRFFAPGGEFARIEAMFPAARFTRDGRGPGDDAFVWNPGSGSTWVAASDASAEDVHYRLDWATPAQALRKALLANLSDINAMGGRTRFALFNLGARADWSSEVYASFGACLRELEEAYGFVVNGGDTALLDDRSFFSFTVLGTVDGLPLLRSGVRPGHKVYVSGTLGGSSAGLSSFRAGEGVSGSGASDAGSPAREAHLNPAPPLELGPLLASLNSADKPVAAIDVSDGLSSELWHLARQSGCALSVDVERLPLHPALSSLSSLSPFEARAHALHGGEEYQLLFTGDFSPADLQRLRAVTAITAIGTAEAGEGVQLHEQGAVRPLEAGGYKHGGGLRA
jgi:thiamine-monophosphate kinase